MYDQTLIRSIYAVIRNQSGRLLAVRKHASSFYIQPGVKPESGDAAPHRLAG